MRGTELRIRPVVMTSLTAALGLFPAAIATSIGSQAQKPLAIVVVGDRKAVEPGLAAARVAPIVDVQRLK